MIETRKQGKHANVCVDKHIIEGRSYTVDSLGRLPEELCNDDDGVWLLWPPYHTWIVSKCTDLCVKQIWMIIMSIRFCC